MIHAGDEHHDGAVVVDLDFDGDLDILSIGWGHGKVLWYENLRRTCLSPRYAKRGTARVLPSVKSPGK